jgi:two-component system chemotaxis response regulator CheY
MAMRALVVDDSRAVRAIVVRTLRELGFEIAEAGDGAQALAWLAANGPVDVALVDWNMPEVDGYELVCRVRADARYAGMRLMMVTSESEISQVERALAAGADEYLMKPFTKDAVLAKLQLLGLA